jgi:hypothetical protein
MNALRIFDRRIIRKTYDNTKEEEKCKIRIDEGMQDILQGTHLLKYCNMISKTIHNERMSKQIINSGMEGIMGKKLVTVKMCLKRLKRT